MTGRPRQWDIARGKWRIRAIRSSKWWRERGQKGLSFIPHLFTLGNLAFGILSIMLSTRGEYEKAALMVVGSLVADGLDGRVARWLGADGEFGKQMDSLADVVAFGTAPALLLYEMRLHEYGYLGIAITLLFPMCGALRLARFNIIKTSGFFLGVPITAAGTMLSCVAFYFTQETTGDPMGFLIPTVMLVLSYLMISTIPYPDFKKKPKGAGVNPWPAVGPLAVMIIVLISARWNPWTAVILPLTLYVSLGPWLLLLKQWNEKVQPWIAGQRNH